MIPNKRYTFIIIFIVVIASMFSTGCNNNQKVRKLNEKTTTIAPQQDKSAAIEPEDKKFNWQKPDHWQARESKGLRLATFSINDRILCTLIPLSKDGGGLRANINRWLAQLELQLTSQQVNSFLASNIDFKTKTNLSAIFLDFSTLLANENKLSMLVTIITTPNSTLFIKMTGSKLLLKKQRDSFITFCKSISHSQ